MDVKSVRFKYARVDINYTDRLVATHFDNGRSCVASREPNEMNRNEARDEGYGTAAGDTPDMVWHCLKEHELAHCFIPEKLWDSPSPALMTECGNVYPYHQRLFEESLVIGFQIYLNTGKIPQQLQPFSDRLSSWKAEFVKLTEGL
jgi:hypothetical protein